MLAQKQPLIQRVRNSSLVERLCAENLTGLNLTPKLRQSSNGLGRGALYTRRNSSVSGCGVYRSENAGMSIGIRAFLANLFGNVLAFMPFGFFMPILRLRLRKWYCMLGMTFLLSLMIEITQLLTRVGSFDVDDLILNTSGGILGYLLFYIINKVRRKWNGA